MFRNELDISKGMIFIYDSPGLVKMWMRNTLIPLDMIFIRDKTIIKIVNNALPCFNNNCINYESNGFIDTVIEVNAGISRKIGLRVGDSIDLLEDISENHVPSHSNKYKFYY